MYKICEERELVTLQTNLKNSMNTLELAKSYANDVFSEKVIKSIINNIEDTVMTLYVNTTESSLCCVSFRDCYIALADTVYFEVNNNDLDSFEKLRYEIKNTKFNRMKLQYYTDILEHFVNNFSKLLQSYIGGISVETQ